MNFTVSRICVLYDILCCHAVNVTTTTTTTTILRPSVWDYSGKPVPEEIFTHSHISWSWIILYLLAPYYDPWYTSCSIYVHDSLFLQRLSKSSLVYLLVWHLPLHTSDISSPNHCLLFATHVHTITTCFAVVPRLSSNPRFSLNSLLATLYFTLTSRIHMTILISARWSATSFSFLTGLILGLFHATYYFAHNCCTIFVCGCFYAFWTV